MSVWPQSHWPLNLSHSYLVYVCLTSIRLTPEPIPELPGICQSDLYLTDPWTYPRVTWYMSVWPQSHWPLNLSHSYLVYVSLTSIWLTPEPIPELPGIWQSDLNLTDPWTYPRVTWYMSVWPQSDWPLNLSQSYLVYFSLTSIWLTPEPIPELPGICQSDLNLTDPWTYPRVTWYMSVWPQSDQPPKLSQSYLCVAIIITWGS